ncbi:MAG: hypothetical protein ACREKS_16625 [Candidatus Rokuibacteriota bacterium]
MTCGRAILPVSPALDRGERTSSMRAAAGVLLVVAYASVVVTFALRSIDWPLVHDAPIMHYIAWRISDGAVPYRDLFDMNMAGTYLIHLGALEAFGASDAGWRAFDLAWLLATSLALAAFARPWGWVSATGSALLFAVYHLAGGALQAGQRDFFLVIFLVLGALGVARWAAGAGSVTLACGGLALGAGMTIKPHAVLLAGALAVVVLVVGNRSGSAAMKPVMIFSVAAALVPAVVVMWIAASGGLPAWRDIVMHYLVPYYARLGRGHSSWAFRHWQVWIPLTAVMLALGNAVIAGRYTVRHTIATLGVAYGFVHYLGQGKGWAYHLYPLAAFVALLAFSELRVALLQRPIIGVPLAVSLAVTLVGLTQIGVEASRGSWIRDKEQMVEALTQDLGPLRTDDSVQMLDTTDGGIHALLRLRARQPTRFLYDFHFFHDEETVEIRSLRAEFMRELTARPPRFIVFFRRGWPEGGPERIARFPELERRLAERYRVVHNRPRYMVYEKRRDS